MGRDCCPQAGCFLCGTKCGSGRKGSGDRCIDRKSAKYSGLSSSHIFIPAAVESLGPLADDAHRFITEIGRRMTFSTWDPRETAFLYQRISVATGDLTLQRRLSCKHFHFRSAVVIPNIIIFIVIVVVIIIIIIIKTKTGFSFSLL